MVLFAKPEQGQHLSHLLGLNLSNDDNSSPIIVTASTKNRDADRLL